VYGTSSKVNNKRLSNGNDNGNINVKASASIAPPIVLAGDFNFDGACTLPPSLLFLFIVFRTNNDVVAHWQ
jgi:hypothetical protein